MLNVDRCADRSATLHAAVCSAARAQAGDRMREFGYDGEVPAGMGKQQEL